MKKKKQQPKKKRTGFLKLSGRHGVTLVVLLAVLILLINIVTFSYSWFTPEVKKSTGMSYQGEGGVRSESCSATTYALNQSNGELSDGSVITSETAVPITAAEGIRYFKTYIYNNSFYDTNISLYLGSAPVSDTAFSLGVMTPSNSYHTYSGQRNDVNIIRNAHIQGGVTKDEDFVAGEREVIWFIKTEADISIDMTKLYIVYN